MQQEAIITPCSITSDNTVYRSFSGATINHLNLFDGICHCLAARDGSIVEVTTPEGREIKAAFCNECAKQVIPKGLISHETDAIC